MVRLNNMDVCSDSLTEREESAGMGVSSPSASQPHLSSVMDLYPEWKSLFPITHSNAPPLLLPRATPSSPSPVGPLLFNPKPATTTLLLSSPNLSLPSSILPPPSLSVPRFLQTDSAGEIAPTTSTAISTSFNVPLRDTDRSMRRNRLEPLHCAGGRTFAFFPTGENLDRVGFVLLKVRDSRLCVEKIDHDDVFTSTVKFNHRILRLSACVAVDAWDDSNEDGDIDGKSISSKADVTLDVGYLMACTMFSVHWFKAIINGFGTPKETPFLVLLGSKLFKSSAIADACWNPHLPEESLVLLESGDLFLFDVHSSSSVAGTSYLNVRSRGLKLKISSGEPDEFKEQGLWCGCAFSWHPRIVVLANSSAVFLADFRSEECALTCLMKLKLLGDCALVEKDQFVELCKAGSDGFYIVAASRCWLILLDIRKPFMPLLRWMHYHHEPNYISVFPLSTLRPTLGIGEYDSASEVGYAILLGSFLTGDFSLFCYGPNPSSANKNGSSGSFKFSESFNAYFNDSFYAWELPSKLSLSGRGCPCGSCILKKEFAKDDLPEWIEWQHRDTMAVGFFFMDTNASSLLSKPDNNGGFVLVRLMSSGKLESQSFAACEATSSTLEPLHGEIPLDADISQAWDSEEYRFVKKYSYLKLDHLYAYLNDSLAKVLSSKFQKNLEDSSRKKGSRGTHDDHFHEMLAQYGLNKAKVSDAVKDTGMPLSVYEVASKKMWTELPVDILKLAFSNYEEFLGVLLDGKKVSLDFLPVKDQDQMPPFFGRDVPNRSNRWSHKVQPRNDDAVGPTLPLPASLVFNETCKIGQLSLISIKEFSPLTMLVIESQEVMRTVNEMAASHSSIDVLPDHAVSLADEKEEAWNSSQNQSPFVVYKPTALSEDLPILQDEFLLEDSFRFTTMIAQLLKDDERNGKRELDSMEFTDDICPIKLHFDDSSKGGIAPEELSPLELLKGQFTKWQSSFKPYTKFCEQLKNQ